MKIFPVVCILACAGCLAPATDDAQSCFMAACPAGGAASYSLCAIPNGCGYRTSDGKLFACASCHDCADAAARTMQWCGSAASSASTDTAACAACISSAEAGSCASALAACQADAGCAALASCAGACNGDAACLAGCRMKASSAAAQLLATFSLCVSGACTASCGSGSDGGTSGASDGGTGTGGSGGAGGGDGGPAASACDACATGAEQSSCAARAAACAEDPDCIALRDCVDSCGSSACEDGCWNAAPPWAADELDAFYGCVCQVCSGSCAAECS